MKRVKYLVLATSLSLLVVGCGRHHEAVASDSTASNSVPTMLSGRGGIQSTSDDYQQAKDAALAYAAKAREDRIRGIPLPPSQFPFPNYPAGPLNPRPIHVNFYAINDHYQTYLLCQYDLDEKNYDQSKEEGWFKASLEQIRKLGPQKFPSIEWIAVIINNRAEWKDVSTIDQAHKAGAIFKATDVFDSSRDVSQFVAQAGMDRHPFLLDQKQPTPGEQQRWVIVEHHAATNHTITGSN
jgi:hypothetical protein